MKKNKYVRYLLIVLLLLATPFVWYFGMMFYHFVFLEFVGENKLKQAEELKGTVDKEYIDHVLFKGYKSEEVSMGKVEYMALVASADFIKQGENVKFVNYNKYFTTMFVVIYDEHNTELCIYPVYE